MNISTLYWVVFGVCLALAALFIVIRLKYKAGEKSTVFKTVASCSVLLLSILAFLNTKTVYINVCFLVMVGMVCCLIGDILLELKVFKKENERNLLIGGFMAFLGAHLFNLASLIVFGIYLSIPFYAYLIAAIVGLAIGLSTYFGLQKFFHLDFKGYEKICISYISVLAVVMCISLLMAIYGGAQLIVLPLGFISFCLSDVILSFEYFKTHEEKPVMTLANFITYYGGIILIMFSMVIVSYL